MNGGHGAKRSVRGEIGAEWNEMNFLCLMLICCNSDGMRARVGEGMSK